jgi:hypothetical protein
VTLPLIIIAMLLLAGGLAIGGVYLLTSPAWAMLAAAVVLLGYAIVLRAGLA